MFNPSQIAYPSSQSISLRLTPRDERILETIHAYDGVLSLKQIDRLYFSGAGRSQPRARMRRLFRGGFIVIPDALTAHRVPYGETIYWLAAKGAAVVASLHGKKSRELRWRRTPRYSMLAHDLAVNDFRIAVRQSITGCAQHTLAVWLSENTLARQGDRVRCPTTSGKIRKRVIRPDGFFVIRSARSERKQKFAFLLEIDRGTEDGPRFVREKVLPGIAYLGSDLYAKRYGLRYGRYLVVTTGWQRLANLKEQTERAGGSGRFYFTTFGDLKNANVLEDPIWHLAGAHTPGAIVHHPTLHRDRRPATMAA